MYQRHIFSEGFQVGEQRGYGRYALFAEYVAENRGALRRIYRRYSFEDAGHDFLRVLHHFFREFLRVYAQLRERLCLRFRRGGAGCQGQHEILYAGCRDFFGLSRAYYRSSKRCYLTAGNVADFAKRAYSADHRGDLSCVRRSIVAKIVYLVSEFRHLLLVEAKSGAPICHPVPRLLSGYVESDSHLRGGFRKIKKVVFRNAALTARSVYLAQLFRRHRDAERELLEIVRHLRELFRRIKVYNLLYARHCAFELGGSLDGRIYCACIGQRRRDFALKIA